MADGKIVVEVDAETKEAAAKLKQLERDIAKTKKTIESLEAKKSPLTDKAEALRIKIKELTTDVEKYTKAWMSGEGGAESKLVKAEDALRSTKEELDGVIAEIDKIDAKLLPAYDSLDEMEAEAAALNTQMSQVEVTTSSASTAMEKLKKRIIGLAKRVLVFSVITRALRAFVSWVGTAVKANDEASAAMARLKGALLTMAQPLLNIVIPAFTFLINILTRVISTIATFISMLNGGIDNSKKQAQALQQQTKGYNSAGSAAKDASEAAEEYKDATSGIDELNIISPQQETDTSSGGGGSGGGTTATPDFDFETENASSFFDILLTGTAIVAALALAFGKLGAGIGFIITSAMLLIDAWNDINESGITLENTLEMIAGIMLGGLGISLLVGSWIPLLIASIASVLYAIATLTGHGEELIGGLKQTFQGFIDFFVGIFTGDMERATEGIKNIFAGLEMAVNAILDSILDIFIGLLSKIDELTGGNFHDTIETAKRFLRGLFESVRQVFGGIIDFVSGIFAGDWEKAIKGIVNILIGILNAGITATEGVINIIIDAINVLLGGVSDLVSWAGDLLGLGTVNWRIPPVNLTRIPELARGAVIPPNREFLAVLGDQKSGTNIEAPLDTIKQAVAEVLAQNGGGTDNRDIVLNITAMLDGEVVYRNQERIKQRLGYPMGLNPNFSY